MGVDEEDRGGVDMDGEDGGLEGDIEGGDGDMRRIRMLVDGRSRE